MSDTQYAIELRGITKIFGEIIANDKVDLTVNNGEILALLGENGSGKTTLMNILSGIYHPDAGTIKINGKEVVINSPKDSFALKIGMIHQHFKLVEVMTAFENILLGTNNKLNRKKAAEEIKTLCDKFSLKIDLKKRVCNMSVSEKQTVEIVKVLYRGANILILDEPTAVLTPQETQNLFEILRAMKKDGKAVIIITHKLNEVLEISDRVMILRKGKSIDSIETAKANAKILTEAMVGQAIDLEIERPETEKEPHALDVRHLSVKGADGRMALKDVTFDISSGEILGVAGVAGSGQKELCETIAGLHKVEKGAILFKKENIVGKTPSEIIKAGISMSFIPEDRLGMGLVASMDITHNMLLKSYKNSKGIFLDRKEAKKLAEDLVEKLSIKTPNVSTPVRLLSGGNVQKVLIGREIESNPQLLITAYPERGLDINSSYTIYNLINKQKQNGSSVLFIGEDLDVLLELCDRILVLCHGEVMGVVNAREVTKEDLGFMMAGQKISDGGENNG
ncbi:MAG: ABC transporter ATP-binding protein [Clostridia bacterium]|nr:ABC transporter ATP-binding protein [Clostridia bacterium]